MSKAKPSPINSNHDPMEAIYALNIGDFVAENFISDELLDKISMRLGDDPHKLQAQLEELVQIYSMDKTLGIMGFEATDGFVIYDSLCQTLARMFQTDACHLFQVSHKDTGEDALSLSGTSQGQDISAQHRWEIGIQTKANDWLADAFKHYEPWVVEDSAKLPNWHPISALGQSKSQRMMAVPLKEGGKALGLLLFEQHDTQRDFGPELIQLAQTAAQVFVTGMRLQHLVAQAQTHIQQASHQDTPLHLNTLLSLRAQITESIADLGVHQQRFVEALAGAVDARNDFTHGHSKAVAQVAQAIGEAMALNEKTVDLVYYAGLLGSIGKIHIPQSVLEKSGKLSPDEWEALRNHPNVGVSLLGKINFLAETTPYVQSQKERWDGSGSPEGLSNRSIPLGSRILAVADAYFAMTHPRPYRGQPLSHAEAIAVLQQEAGSNWDPTVVEALSKIPADSLA